MSWQLFTAISVFSLSASVVLQRLLLNKQKLDPYAYVVVFQTMVGVLLMVAALLVGFKLPNIENLLLPAGLSVICFGIGHLAYAKTLQIVEASAFSVLFATQAIWIMMMGIALFNESITSLQILGTVFILGSILLIAKDPRAMSFDRGTLLGLLTGLLFSLAIVSWSHVGRNTDPLSWAAISFVGTALVVFLIHPKALLGGHGFMRADIFTKLFVLCITYAVGSLTMLYAYREGTFSVVTPLRQTSIILTVILALFFIKNERNKIAHKLLAALISFVGVVLIVT